MAKIVGGAKGRLGQCPSQTWSVWVEISCFPIALALRAAEKSEKKRRSLHYAALASR
jgi:hypothetical protein